MGPKSITNGTNLAQGEGRGNRKSTKTINNKCERKEPKQEKMLFSKCGAIFSKIGGLNGWAFTVFFLFQQM
jgi:hypothetical protein